MENVERIKTLRVITVSVAAIICVSIAGYFYYERGRYEIVQGINGNSRQPVDKYTKDVYEYNSESKNFRR